jgi:hypothetical protein
VLDIQTDRGVVGASESRVDALGEPEAGLCIGPRAFITANGFS